MEYDVVKRRVDSLMARTWAEVMASKPDGVHNPTDAQEVVIGLSAWSRALFRAVGCQIDGRVPFTAHVTCRALLETSLTLEYFRQHQRRLDAIVLAWQLATMQDEAGLQREGAASFPGVGEWPVDTDAERRQLMQRARSQGLTPKDLRPLPKGKALAQAIGHGHLYWVYRYQSMAVHPSRLALGSVMSDTATAEPVIGTEPDPHDAVRSGHTAVRALLSASVAEAELLGWSDANRDLLRHAELIDADWVDLMKDVGIAMAPVEGHDAQADDER